MSPTESTIRLSKFKATETVPDFSPRPTNPNSLLVSFLTKTSHIEIHDQAPVNVAYLFFKILQTITGLTTFRSFALILPGVSEPQKNQNESSCTPHPSRRLSHANLCLRFVFFVFCFVGASAWHRKPPQVYSSVVYTPRHAKTSSHSHP